MKRIFRRLLWVGVYFIVMSPLMYFTHQRVEQSYAQQPVIQTPVVVAVEKTNVTPVGAQPLEVTFMSDVSRPGEVNVEQVASKTTQAEDKRSSGDPRDGIFLCTSYDLSYDSCQKSPGDDAYGQTADGTFIINKTWDKARTIAVDPTLIKYGTVVRLTFKDPAYSKYNGEYVARDTGAAIKGRHIDFFMGDFHSTKKSKQAVNFGRTDVLLEVIPRT